MKITKGISGLTQKALIRGHIYMDYGWLKIIYETVKRSFWWREWEAGIKNAVGIFGSSLSDAQSGLLQMSGAHTLIILTDNDEAGQKARNSIKQKCQTLFIISEPTFSFKDVGDMTTEQILSELKHQL